MAERKELDEALRNEYPSNSHSTKEYSSLSKPKQNTKEKHVQKVVKGKVVKKKKSTGKRLAETFLEDDSHNVIEYIIYDILIPSAKETISNVVSNGVEMLLFGESRGTRTYRDRGRTGRYPEDSDSRCGWILYSKGGGSNRILSERQPVTRNCFGR